MDCVSLDLGFGYTKARSAVRRVAFPSVVGEGRQLLETLGAGDPLDSIIVEVGPRRYFVGALALRQSGLRYFSLAEQRARDETSRIIALAALGLVADGPCRVVSGLPVAWFFGQRGEFARFLEGEHTVRVGVGRGAVREKRVSVEAVKLVPQPLGSYLLRLYAEDSRPDARFASETVGVVDIGFQTLDLLVVSRLEVIQPLSASTKSGVVQAYRWLGDALRERFGLVRELYEIDDVARQGYVMQGGRRHSIDDLLDTARDYLGQLIRADIATHWAGAGLDRVLVTGGGAYHVGDRLSLPGPVIEVLDNPAEANVEGYARLGRRDATWTRAAT